MFKSMMIAGSLAVGALAMAPAAEAETNFSVHLGVPFYGYQVEPDWDYYDGYGWYDDDRYGDFDRYHRRESSNFQLYFGIPFYSNRVGPDWRFYEGYGWYDYPRYGDFRRRTANKLTCNQARRLIDRSGYDRVQVRECEGQTYTFRAVRNGKRVTVNVNARTGKFWRG